MRFGVIVCPECRKARGIDLSVKTVRCIYCGKRLQINHIKIFYKTNSIDELRRVIGLINADADGRVEEFKKLFEKRK